MRVVVREQVFESVNECADHFGIKPISVYWMLCNDKADSIGLGKGAKPPGNPNYRSGVCKSFKVGGVTYRSLGKASVALGWHHKRLEVILRERGPIQMQNLYKALLAADAKAGKSAAKLRNSPTEGTDMMTGD